jgi:phytoene synthase
MNALAIRQARAVIAHHSKSFALASRLLPPGVREEVWVLYQWCRRADDLIDLAPSPEAQVAAIKQLRMELDSVYARAPQEDPALAALQEVLLGHDIPREYPEELLKGLIMDMGGLRYEAMEDLLLYCYRVAGVVGLMMSHVMGVRDPVALRHAVHLGIAMQLTNICRDVREDWERGRLYIPDSVLARFGGGGLHTQFGAPLTHAHAGPLSAAVRFLLHEADRYYASADGGIPYLSWRCGVAVRAARLIYARIGAVIARQQYDVFAGRAYVRKRRKLALAVCAMGATARDSIRRESRRFQRAPLRRVVRFPVDVLPV